MSIVSPAGARGAFECCVLQLGVPGKKQSHETPHEVSRARYPRPRRPSFERRCGHDHRGVCECTVPFKKKSTRLRFPRSGNFNWSFGTLLRTWYAQLKDTSFTTLTTAELVLQKRSSSSIARNPSTSTNAVVSSGNFVSSRYTAEVAGSLDSSFFTNNRKMKGQLHRSQHSETR